MCTHNIKIAIWMSDSDRAAGFVAVPGAGSLSFSMMECSMRAYLVGQKR